MFECLVDCIIQAQFLLKIQHHFLLLKNIKFSNIFDINTEIQGIQ